MLDDILANAKERAKTPRPVHIRKWVWDSTKNSNMTWIWCECIAWNKLPEWLCKPVTVVYNSKNGVTDRYHDQEEMNNAARDTTDKFMDKSNLDRFLYESQIEQEKLLQVAKDIEGLKTGGLPDEIIFKVYEILLNQYSEVCKYSNLAEIVKKEGEKRLEKFKTEEGKESEIIVIEERLKEIDVKKAQLQETSDKTIEGTRKLFDELAKRTGQKISSVMVMSPEDIKFAIHTGKVEDWEIEGKMKHYIMVYDWEKIDPMVYTLEKARVMELSFKFEKPAQ